MTGRKLAPRVGFGESLTVDLFQLRDLPADALLDLVGDEADVRVQVRALALVVERGAVVQLDRHPAELIDAAARAAEMLRALKQ